MEFLDIYQRKRSSKRKRVFREKSEGDEAKINNAYITQGSIVLGEVKNSVIGTGAEIGKGAKVVDSVIQPGAKIGEGAKVTRCIVADNVEVAPGAVLGSSKSEHIDLVAKKYAE